MSYHVVQVDMQTNSVRRLQRSNDELQEQVDNLTLQVDHLQNRSAMSDICMQDLYKSLKTGKVIVFETQKSMFRKILEFLFCVKKMWKSSYIKPYRTVLPRSWNKLLDLQIVPPRKGAFKSLHIKYCTFAGPNRKSLLCNDYLSSCHAACFWSIKGRILVVE